MEKKKLILLAITFLSLSLLSLVALIVYTGRRNIPLRILPALGQAPEFTMTNAENKPFSSADLKGKVWVADFFFTDCAGPCPTMGKQMQRLAAQTTILDLQLVSISVNPAADTPEKLATYAKKFRADLSRWHFLTAPSELVQEVSVNGFKVGSDQIINHSTYFSLVDRSGIIRGYYDGTDKKDVSQLLKDLKLLVP